MSEKFLKCNGCAGIVSVAKVHGNTRLACHCTHVDGTVDGPSVDIEPPTEWVWK